MNRIILIGNGFDLAHGLSTSYADFIDYYWEYWGKRLQSSYMGELTDKLCSISQKGEQFMWNWVCPTFDIHAGKKISPKEIIEAVKAQPDDFIIKKKPFFQHIDKSVETKNWVDIENEFYLWLKKIFKKDACEYNSPVPLNEELELIKDKLIEYLKLIEEQIKPELVKDCIRKTIYEPFNINDISVSGQEQFQQFAEDRWKEKNVDKQNNDSSSKNSREKIVECTINMDIENALDEYFRQIKSGNQRVCKKYLLPSEILLLNFNYTHTAELYIPKDSEFKVNHIHGELSNEKNPIIFGYGDELDDDYKEIAKLNDNDYMKNIKSIRYLETDNYRKLLSFIDSAPFQIYIMGHSCGNSDRTLLNTLFEHKNCVSIKPFYYQKPGGTDNYIEIVQNISRNFNDMRLMRDRVVNKTYCRPMVEVTTE